MKQYIHHPERDEVLEFEVPDGAVYFAIGGVCPRHSSGDRRIVGIDYEAKSYQCGMRHFVPLDEHNDIPAVRWSATIPKVGDAHGTVVRDGQSTIVRPLVIPGGQYASAGVSA